CDLPGPGVEPHAHVAPLLVGELRLRDLRPALAQELHVELHGLDRRSLLVHHLPADAGHRVLGRGLRRVEERGRRDDGNRGAASDTPHDPSPFLAAPAGRRPPRISPPATPGPRAPALPTIPATPAPAPA